MLMNWFEVLSRSLNFEVEMVWRSNARWNAHKSCHDSFNTNNIFFYAIFTNAGFNKMFGLSHFIPIKGDGRVSSNFFLRIFINNKLTFEKDLQGF